MNDPKELADYYFARQCERLGPIEGVAPPRPIRDRPMTDKEPAPPSINDQFAKDYWQTVYNRFD